MRQNYIPTKRILACGARLWAQPLHILIYIYIHNRCVHQYAHMCVHICIYAYTEREREIHIYIYKCIGLVPLAITATQATGVGIFGPDKVLVKGPLLQGGLTQDVQVAVFG